MGNSHLPSDCSARFVFWLISHPSSPRSCCGTPTIRSTSSTPHTASGMVASVDCSYSWSILCSLHVHRRTASLSSISYARRELVPYSVLWSTIWPSAHSEANSVKEGCLCRGKPVGCGFCCPRTDLKQKWFFWALLLLLADAMQASAPVGLVEPRPLRSSTTALLYLERTTTRRLAKLSGWRRRLDYAPGWTSLISLQLR